MPTAASSDGVIVEYLHLGGRGPRLLMVHATGFCSTVWRPMAEALADRWSCWALDVRGHGRSTTPTGSDFDWAGTADDVLAVVDALDGEPGADDADGAWFGVGHSMGGAALLLAEQRRPGTFAGLWAYEPVVFPPLAVAAGDGPGPSIDPGEMLAQGALRRRATFASREAAFDNYSSKPPMGSFDHRALRGYLERGLVEDASPGSPAGGVRLACEPEVEAQVYRMGGRHTAWAHLDEVTTPVTIVGGDPSALGPGAFAADLADRLPAGRLEACHDLGHFGPMEVPERLADSVSAAFGTGSLSDLPPTIAP